MKRHYYDEEGFDGLIHLRAAVRAGAEIFITNNSGILKDRRELEVKFNIKIMSPSEFLLLEGPFMGG